MKAVTIRISLAGLTVPLRLRSPVAAEYFRDYLLNMKNEKCPGESRSISVETREAFLTNERLAEGTGATGACEAFAEYSYIIEDVARCIIPYGCSFFHGVAVLYNGGAYLLTGHSGVGKSTQYRNLAFLLGNKVTVLNGDKPVLQFPKAGPIMVHSSPWLGKERWGTAGLKAPLRCIICLEQAEENIIKRLTTCEAVPTVYGQFLYIPETSEVVNRICGFTEKMLGEVPVYKMANKGDLMSSKMLFEQVIASDSDVSLGGSNIEQGDRKLSSSTIAGLGEEHYWREIKRIENIDSDIIRLRPDVLLRTVAGVPLLIAIGAAVADCAAVQGLNITAAILLDRLTQTCAEEELIKYAANVFDAEPEYLREDICEFLAELRKGNYLIENKTAKSGQEEL